MSRKVRVRQGPAATVVLEARDYAQYGWGGRNEENLKQRALRGDRYVPSKMSLDEYLIRGATSSNTGVSDAVVRASSYLRAGGKLLIPLGVGLSLYAVAEAPSGSKLKAAGEEGAGMAGGALASEAAVVLMIVLTPETGGLFLFGIALVAGMGGGGLASWGAHRILFPAHEGLPLSALHTGLLPSHSITPHMPPPPISSTR